MTSQLNSLSGDHRLWFIARADRLLVIYAHRPPTASVPSHSTAPSTLLAAVSRNVRWVIDRQVAKQRRPDSPSASSCRKEAFAFDLWFRSHPIANRKHHIPLIDSPVSESSRIDLAITSACMERAMLSRKGNALWTLCIWMEWGGEGWEMLVWRCRSLLWNC